MCNLSRPTAVGPWLTGPRRAALCGLAPDRLRPVPVQPAAADPGLARSFAMRHMRTSPPNPSRGFVGLARQSQAPSATL